MDTQGIIQNGLLTLLFFAAAVSWLVNPKVGKAVSVVVAVSALLLELVFSGIYYVQIIISLMDFFFLHTVYLMTMIHDVSFLLLYGALLILLIFNRFPPIFGKKAARIEESEDTAAEDITDTEDTDTEDVAQSENIPEPVIKADPVPATPDDTTPAPNTKRDEALFKLFELRANGELSPEEYRKLRDMIGDPTNHV